MKTANSKQQITRWQELTSIEVILNTMFIEQEQKKESYEKILSNRLEELLILLSRHYSNIKTNKAKALVRIGRVIDYIENNYQNNIYIDDLKQSIKQMLC